MAKKTKTEKSQSEQTVVEEFVKQQDVDVVVEKRLLALYTLQSIDTQIDKIRITRGELPLEVQDLEDEIVGLETRINKLKSDIATSETAINEHKAAIETHKAAIEKYTKQQNNVKNNREFESLNKEIEYQGLEIQLCERKMKELKASIKEKNQHVSGVIKGLMSPWPFWIPINLIGDFAVPISLSLRLFANILSGTVMMSLVYGLLSTIAYAWPGALHVYFDMFSGAIQTYVFCMLTMTYIADARTVEE